MVGDGIGYGVGRDGRGVRLKQFCLAFIFKAFFIALFLHCIKFSKQFFPMNRALTWKLEYKLKLFCRIFYLYSVFCILKLMRDLFLNISHAVSFFSIGIYSVGVLLQFNVRLENPGVNTTYIYSVGVLLQFNVRLEHPGVNTTCIYSVGVLLEFNVNCWSILE